LSADGAVFNNAAQVWNHTFFWNCMSPEGGGEPKGKIAQAINFIWKDYGSFQKEFYETAMSNFGSGWTWLVVSKKNELEILNTSNAQTPKTFGAKALLTIDVWEHAYYIDYRNARADYLDSFWKVVNWDFVNRNLA
jgi:Fe-Mn family superoxide dismutase